MSSTKDDIQNKVSTTASILKKAPFLKVPQAMRAANFSDAQSHNPAMQMRVHRYLANNNSAPNHFNTIVTIESPMPTSMSTNIPDEQLARIINFDETCLSLDGSGKRGGRPELVFYNPLSTCDVHWG